MIAYSIRNGRIRIRPTIGGQFEFEVVQASGRPMLRMACPPRWADGATPTNAEFRIYLARAAAQGIAQEAGLLGTP